MLNRLNTSRFFRVGLLTLLTTLAGCATDGTYESRPVPGSRPVPPRPAHPTAPVPVPAPVPEAPRPQAPVYVPPVAPVPAPVPPPSTPSAPVLGERAGRELIERLLPAYVSHRSAWVTDIHAAFVTLPIRLLPENVCATIAIIEQESTFQSNPQVAGLSKIVWREIQTRRERYGIPKLALDLALEKSSPDGRSYKARIDALRTENEVNILYQDMISELPLGKVLLSDYNPVRTGGPMQVSVAFAEEHVRLKPYPYPRQGSLRDEVFTRRGGVYFGIANLLDYRNSYSKMLYRFADFNAGRYSSRNAAFQQAVSRLSGRQLALDGDLLRYVDGAVAPQGSETLRALLSLRPRLDLDEPAILRDLKLEKTLSFEQSTLYQRLYALADAQGEQQPRELIPRIELKSPKITRKLTTEWFARRVEERYRNCLAKTRP
ncbi:MAG TPA: DUF1615 domain-containing protein [Accumulibacter sp.]|nr:DUF1615 domain-containing protein [Accumulibacter sp.]HMW18874.1 DUF1615 domain-containing protein [Accumulibacter sp.]HMY07520.1 DUF1615 domain-containing protein [Accumulibacter sp.]HNC18907.1 DUF1615 domain-containing protein [Accumulibacter sp.]HND81424.1 DUF1615 domain-containing protein [Accumulibacter sp.]